MKTIGIIIVIIGLGLSIFTVVTVFTKEKVVDLGAIEITKEKPHKLNISPLVGIAVMGVGGLVLFLTRKK